MVSRRNYVSTMLMMAVMFFMFQFSQIIKEQGNNYDVNGYASGTRASGADAWEMPTVESMDSLSDRGYVLFIGDAQGDMGKTVEQWCLYTKRTLVAISDCGEYSADKDSLPELILIDSDNINYAKDADNLVAIAKENAQYLVFCNAPDMETLEKYDWLAKLLGVDEIRTDEAQLSGVDLFSGFLLGGEAVYTLDESRNDEESAWDLPDTVAWYSVGAGTKTYMVGMVDDEDVDQQDYPAIIWRNSFYGSQVYVAADGFMSGSAGLGILDAVAYEMSDYQIYPIVNARNTVVVDYPGLAAENEAEMQKLYSRSQSTVQKDVIWPEILSLAETSSLTLTFYVSPQYYYSDGIEPDGSEMVFYLQQFNEIGAEAGWSLSGAGDTGISARAKSDAEFFASLDSEYTYSAVYADADDEELADVLMSEGLSDVLSVASLYEEGEPIVSYLTDDVTGQRITADAARYSYTDDFLMRSLLTSLGYTNTMIDMHSIILPDSEELQWADYFETVSSNINTYWNTDDAFDRTTASESDVRIRNFLNLSYTQQRVEDMLVLTKEGADEAYFILRTHGDAVDSAKGAEYEELEEDAYLIHMTADTAYIYLEAGGSVQEYPFAE